VSRPAAPAQRRVGFRAHAFAAALGKIDGRAGRPDHRSGRRALREAPLMPSDTTVAGPPRVTKGRFFAMAGSYALGIFNDNFFKQSALLLAVAAKRGYLQGVATAIFA